MDVWSKGCIGKVIVSNRFVHTAVGEGMATENGAATQRLRDRYALLGRGGAIGLIITGHSYVAKSGQMRHGQTGAYADNLIRGLAAIASAAQRDGSRIFLQISHGGIASPRELTGQEAMGPSAIQPEGQGTVRAMSISEIEEVIGQFAEAARRAEDAGFDGVQVHLAHGFLGSQFLSPCYNLRDDAYGGSAERRATFPAQIVKAIREKVGSGFAVTAKINGMDFLPGGMSQQDAIIASRLMKDSGLDGLEVSGGICIPNKNPEATPFPPVHPVTLKGACYFADLAAAHRAALNIPVTVVGGIRREEAANDLLNQGKADFIGICRPIIREPDLLLRWREGRPDAPTCTSCNQCLGRSRTGGVQCPAPL